MGKKLDLTGHRFGRLTVLGKAERDKSGHLLLRCRCDCGTEVTVQRYHLKSGITRSCGCLNTQKRTERLTKHGLCKVHHRLYTAIRYHFQAIKNSVRSYGGWQIDSRYTLDSTGVIKFCEDLIALRPDECERYEKTKFLEMDKDNDIDRIFRPESIVFVSHTENINNRKNTKRLKDGTPFTEFCRRVGIETCNRANPKGTKQYDKYSYWFTHHNGEGHPELVQKANEVINTMSKCLRMLELLNEVRAFREQLYASVSSYAIV